MNPTEHALPIPKLERDLDTLRHSIAHHLNFTVVKDQIAVQKRDWLNVFAHTVRDYLVERWMDTTRRYYQQDARRVYYLSMEFLLGRALVNNMLNLGLYEDCKTLLNELGLEFNEIGMMESDPALGNGGLGRLAACFLDSLSTLDLPGYGYGLRYEYGMFYQRIKDGQQFEQPDNWLRYENPWEIPRPEVLYPVHFGGRLVEYHDEQGQLRHDWADTDDIMAMAYDMPIAGYGGKTVNTLRLWAAKSSRSFNLQCFNQGEYLRAVENKTHSENLVKVLYPDDTTEQGKELRLRQEYFFVSATIKDVIRRYLGSHSDIHGLPEGIAIQLNDTHPALTIPELMRQFLDRFKLDWNTAWDMTTRICSYTNHTLLPEALETWPVPLFERLLPRHLRIIYDINWHFLQQVKHQCPGDTALMQRVSLIDEGQGKRIRMGHLAVVGSHKINGVAALHTQLMKSTIFADFERLLPGRIVNKTNGITPRRWLNEANPALTQLIHQHIKSDWLRHLDTLEELTTLAHDSSFQADFAAIKHQNKVKLAEYIQQRVGIIVNPDSLFDVHIKRIHEYKRQLLNVLHLITRYNRIRENPDGDFVPRVAIFAGKAAPGYIAAKRIIKLINDVADVINHDPLMQDRLKVVFLPNYDVSSAQVIIPAADLSEQISTAGTEASGTGNMKLALNGALTIGTLDGANVEMQEEVGADNIFIFGLTSEGVMELQQRGYNPWQHYQDNAELHQVLDMIRNGYFNPEHPDRFQPIFDHLTSAGDPFFLLADYADYITSQDQVDALYLQPSEWTRRAILNVAKMGKFSSDRTIREYAKDIWNVQSSLSSDAKTL